jgi:hypothetical protein
MLFLTLDADPRISAQGLPVTYLVKLPLEAAQIASTAAMLLGTSTAELDAARGYKPTHVNHPACRWAARSWSHVVTVCRYALAMCSEYSQTLRPPAEARHLAVEERLHSLLALALSRGGNSAGTDDPPPLTIDSAGDALAEWIRRQAGGSVYRAFRLYLTKFKRRTLGNRWKFSLATYPGRRKKPDWLSNKRVAK